MDPEPNSAADLEASIRAAEQAGDWAQVATMLAQLKPQNEANADYWSRLASAQRLSGAKVQALSSFRRAHAIADDSVPTLTAIAEIYCELGAREQASKWIDQTRSMVPENLHVRYVRALILIERFQLDEAVRELRELLDLCPTHERALSALLYLLNLIDSVDPGAVADEHCHRATACYGSAPAIAGSITGAALNKRSKIRVGFISGDFRDHPVGRFAQPLLAHLDRDRFELYGYSTSTEDDQLGQQIRREFSQHHDAATDTDDALEQRLRADQLDMLIDLSGHTAGQRMRVLARRPAPIQIQWLGYPNTSGLSAFDYRILDSVLAPLGERMHGSEEILRLPGSFACFRLPANQAELIERDCEALVLASPHRLEKLSDGVVELWATILNDQPAVKLLLLRDQLDGPRRAALSQRFRSHGVAPERLIYRQDIGTDYWSIYWQFDVLLDCFPWTGHTLACEALWMGVPVVTLRGNSVASRLTASALSAAGLQHCVADDQMAYRQIVGNLLKRQQTRSQRRAILARSRLCDEQRFAADFAAQLETISARSI